MPAAGGRRVERLPPGRHGLSPAQVRDSQRRRLTTAATELLAERGYGRITLTGVAKAAGVSTATFYQHFDDLWACLLAAYEAGAERFLERIDRACGESAGARGERARAGISAALELLASEPSLALLLSTEPPSRAAPLWAARLHLASGLAAKLQSVRAARGDDKREAHLIGGAFSLVSIRARTKSSERLESLAPTLAEMLLAP